MMTKRCVIFDLDGVLVDSEPYWREGFRAAVSLLAEKLGAPNPELPDDVLTRYEGGRVPDTIARLAAASFGPANEAVRQLMPEAVDKAVETALELMAQNPTAIEQSVAVAHTLRHRGYLLAVASSSAPRFIQAALAAIGLADEVDVVVSAFHLPEGKPDPRVYLDALWELRASRECSVAVEDSRVGVEAALAAGLRTIWVTNAAPESLGQFQTHPELRVVRELTADDVQEMLKE